MSQQVGRRQTADLHVRAEAVAECGIDAAAGERPPADLVVGDLDAGAIVSKESAQGLTTLGDEGGGFGCEVSELVLGRERDRSRFLDLALSQPLASSRSGTLF
jgi:hypothetical protein